MAVNPIPGTDAKSYIASDGTLQEAAFGQGTGSGDVQETVLLAEDGEVAEPQQIYGGDYVVRATATDWGGATVALEALDADGVSFYALVDAESSPVSFTADGTSNFGAGSNAVVRATVSGGSPTGLFVSVSRLP